MTKREANVRLMVSDGTTAKCLKVYEVYPGSHHTTDEWVAEGDGYEFREDTFNELVDAIKCDATRYGLSFYWFVV